MHDAVAIFQIKCKNESRIGCRAYMSLSVFLEMSGPIAATTSYDVELGCEPCRPIRRNVVI